MMCFDPEGHRSYPFNNNVRLALIITLEQADWKGSVNSVHTEMLNERNPQTVSTWLYLHLSASCWTFSLILLIFFMQTVHSAIISLISNQTLLAENSD